MSYLEMFYHNPNVIIDSHSVLRQGQTFKHSSWTEVKTLPNSVKERQKLISTLSQTKEVWFKTATLGGRARLFYR